MILDSTRPDLLIVVFTRDAALTGMRRELGPSPETITIGRDVGNTLVIPEAGVSRHHARLERRNDDWWIVDLGSANGTYVNGERVETAVLCQGDLLGIGSTTFKCASTELERGIVETSYNATPIDGLTQAYNRRYLLEQIDQQLEHAGRSGRRLTLARFDVERFKAVNDTALTNVAQQNRSITYDCYNTLDDGGFSGARTQDSGDQQTGAKEAQLEHFRRQQILTCCAWSQAKTLPSRGRRRNGPNDGPMDATLGA